MQRGSRLGFASLLSCCHAPPEVAEAKIDDLEDVASTSTTDVDVFGVPHSALPDTDSEASVDKASLSARVHCGVEPNRKEGREEDSEASVTHAPLRRASASSLLTRTSSAGASGTALYEASLNAHITVIEPFSPVFYLNIVLLNKDEVIDKKVHEKLAGRGPLGISAKLACVVARIFSKDEAVSKVLAEKLVEAVPKQVAEMGIFLDLTTQHVGGPLVVLRAHIQETDPERLMSQTRGPEAGQSMKELCHALDVLQLAEAKEKLSCKILHQAKTKLMEKLVVTLPDKLYEAAGARVEMSALEEKEEAEWLLAFLRSDQE